MGHFGWSVMAAAIGAAAANLGGVWTAVHGDIAAAALRLEALDDPDHYFERQFRPGAER